MPFHWPRAHHVTANYGLFMCLAANNILLMRKWIHAFLSTVPLAWKFAISEFPGPLYQNEVKCSAFDMEMIFILMQIQKKSCAIGLILKVRVFGTIADRFVSRRYSLKDKLGDRMIKKLNAKYRDFSVASRSLICVNLRFRQTLDHWQITIFCSTSSNNY